MAAQNLETIAKILLNLEMYSSNNKSYYQASELFVLPLPYQQPVVMPPYTVALSFIVQ